jgi:ribosome-binding factor A
MNVKIQRLNNAYAAEISKIIAMEIRDDDISFVTITGCDISSDLSYAKVYFTVLDESKKQSTLKALNNASGFIRMTLANRIDIRHTPELKFIFDDSIENGQRIENIIDNLK